MVYTKEATERNGALSCADMMAVAARTAPKACGIDLIETLVLDGEDKDRLTAAMREIGTSNNKPFFIRDAGNVDDCHCIVLIGTSVKPRGLNCGFCGIETCSSADEGGISCAMSVNDLGIAIGSAAATAMDHRVDNRVLFTAGKAALKLGLFPDKVKIACGIGLAVKGKNVFFDRKPL